MKEVSLFIFCIKVMNYVKVILSFLFLPLIFVPLFQLIPSFYIVAESNEMSICCSFSLAPLYHEYKIVTINIKII